MSSAFGLLTAVVAVVIYGYSLYFMETNKNIKSLNSSKFAGKLGEWGYIRFLTYQCLNIQLLNAILHVLAYFISPLKKVRDYVFSGLAFPVGCIVVSTFWIVWHGMGREFIFPPELDAVYPAWLNHGTHSIIVPINFLLAALVRHDHSRGSLIVCLIYMLGYTGFLHYLKVTSGTFVYPYLEKLTDTQRHIYFAATGLMASIMFRLGSTFTSTIHGSPSKKVGQRGQVVNKNKLKQK